jgi:hypothetical protein
MRPLIIILFLSFGMFCYGQTKNIMENTTFEYYDNNEDKFGFMIFDSENVDTFFRQYMPIHGKNEKFEISFRYLKEKQYSLEAAEKMFSKHIRLPNNSEIELAKNILTATTVEGNEEYFMASRRYLFFYECLPERFQYLWVQNFGGGFEFNVTFFNLLRTKCKIFDNIIFGSTGYWDKNLQIVFGDKIFNEITSENALLIRHCIDQAIAFNDSRLQTDRENFIYLLDKVIAEKWRLLLIDNN